MAAKQEVKRCGEPAKDWKRKKEKGLWNIVKRRYDGKSRAKLLEGGWTRSTKHGDVAIPGNFEGRERSGIGSGVESCICSTTSYSYS